MLTIKNGWILPYYHFNKIIKVPGASFQSPALTQKCLSLVTLSNTYDGATDFEICDLTFFL